ncbi:hypothetical protein PDESU_02777 [Pontiella desulfatans]|uniref:3-keto-disaccharide hydrolase domain-containing protein n=1 Tax=Pontiella desulfatans TaxID=2750659 RepID=A0A6C2U2K3_PONDE|nr:hypothetical protein [Pontiella desulfatans]VGO14218.1 hypothetical protein PDESU_02777 [Pontiella desulfatans]
MGIGIKRFGGLVSGVLLAGSAFGLDNPMATALDGAIVNYNGLYYGMGAGTNGQMLVSGNLVDWGTPVSVLPENVEGPYESLYRNGVFYLFAQGKGYAVSSAPQGPYSSLRKGDLPGEEMRLFQDDGGALLSVNRRAGSKGEGEIILQRHSTPWKTSGKPDLLLDGRRGMWDSLDSADLGEPDILCYRGNYYLLYAANNPSPRTGLREIGLAVSENPLRLTNVDKVSNPVLVRNAERLARSYNVVLPSGEYSGWEGRFITKPPQEDWKQPGVKLSGWRTGQGGFGYPLLIGDTQLHACRTKWQDEQIWVRREFELLRGTPKTPVLNIRHEGAVQVFLNGKLVYQSATPSIAYSNFDISEAAEGVFRDQDNVIAVQAKAPKNAKYRFLDFGIFDADDLPVEPTIYGLNAPRIVPGPNGFETWVAYQAWWNGVPGTGLDRVFFFDKELVIDGPTTKDSPGYHPPPARPTFSDSFPEDESIEWAERWDFDGGGWMSMDGSMRQNASKGVAKAYLKREPQENYLFETFVRFPAKSKGDAGVVAWSDGEHDLVVSVNPYKKTWEYHIEPGSTMPKRYKLPTAFKALEKAPGMGTTPAPFHRLRITKNGGHFGVELNGINLLPGKPIVTKISGAGVPGFYCKDSGAEFDGVTYTAGWDEHNEYITGWGSAADGTSSAGQWSHFKDMGLEQSRHSEPGRAFKGDLLDQYEFTVNVQTEELREREGRLYGVFPVFADRDNYLQAMIDAHSRELVVTGKLRGREIKPIRRPLKCRIARRHLYDKSTAYSDVTSWVYELRSESIISGLDLRWLEGDFDHLQQEFFVPPDDMVIRYAKLDRGRKPNLWDDGRFYDADEPKPREQHPGILNHVAIREVVGNFVGFGLYVSSAIVIDSRTGRYIRDYVPGEDLGANEEIGDDTSETDTESRPREALITLEVESSYFFRCVKLEDKVIIELNGRPMVEVEGEWPASQVGLVTEGEPCFFNGITLMHLPSEE